jgi:hypothetical protein
LLGSATGDNDGARHQCNARIVEIFKVLESKRDIRDVFLILRGPIYITGRETYSNDSNQIFFEIGNFGNTDTADIFRSSLKRTIEKLSSMGKRIFFVLENPEIGLDPSICFARPFKFGKRDCSIDVSLVRSRQARYREIVKNIQGMIVVDTLQAFCPNNRCQTILENDSLYCDSDHLSMAGSVYQATFVLQPYLKR